MHQARLQAAAVSSDGFLLFDVSMNPIFVNTVAAQILIYPHGLENERDFLLSKIRSTLLLKHSSGSSVLVNRFQSGKRLYFCRTFQVNSAADKESEPSLAVILERGSGRSLPLTDLSERFRLTTREKEVFLCLLQGLTSKEIAARMAISPNTVKAFLRLIMVKMGVSTRSGIVGKAYSIDAFAEPQNLQRYPHNAEPLSQPQLE
jgi:DNA-binding CsgD family transcriptional regulator